MDKGKVIYDICSAPRDMGLDFNEVLHIFNKGNILLWDSENGGVEPKIFMDDFAEIQLIDMAKLSDKEKERLLKEWKK